MRFRKYACWPMTHCAFVVKFFPCGNTLHRIAQFCCWTTAAAVTLNWNGTVACMALSCWKKYPGNMAGHGAELKSPSFAGLRFGKVITITLFTLAVWLFSLA